MINFLHKPCNADGNKATEIGLRLKTKINNVKKNLLEHFLSLRLGTKKLPFLKLSDITDFPKFTEAEMIENIFYGSYYIQRAKSYLSDIIKNNDFVIIDEECIKTIKNTNNKKELQELAEKIKFSKIIGMEILSRHQRSLKTNTMLQWAQWFNLNLWKILRECFNFALLSF